MFLRLGYGRQQQRRKDGDYQNNHQEFNEGECGGPGSGAVRGIC
jgi:hypothetical protein